MAAFGPFRPVVVSTVVSLAVATGVRGGPEAATAPNIVVIMADDLDVGSLRKMLELDLMPHLRETFVDGGVDLANAFVTNALCCPSRATFLTGQYSHNHGVVSNLPPDGGVGAFDDSSTLATWLQKVGYRTGYIGKYLNGYGLHDFNRDGAIDMSDRRHVPPGWDDWQALVDPSTYRVYDYWINDNGELALHGHDPDDYQTDVLARRTADFIVESDALDDDSPFFAVVMPLAPHVEVFPSMSLDAYENAWRWSIRPAIRHRGSVSLLPPRPPSFNERDVSDKPAWLQVRPRLTLEDYLFLVRQYRDRLESLRAIDDLIGSVVDALRRTGELEQTVLVLTSDNGFLYGEHRLSQKLYAYEESVRVPLYVRAPGAAAGRKSDGYVLNNDLAPTIAEIAGAVPELEMDGTSFRPLLDDGGADRPWRRRFVVEQWRARDSIFEVPGYVAVRTSPDSADAPDLLLVSYEEPGNTAEVYDLQSDPFQMESLHAESSPLRKAQRDQLEEWALSLKGCAAGSCRTIEFQ